jgi:hypothetical protein
MAGGGLLALVAATVGLSCSGKNTQKPGLEVIVSTDLRFPLDYNIVQIRVWQQGPDGTYPLIPFKDYATRTYLPQYLTIVPGQSAYQGARITAVALMDLRTVVSRTAEVQLPTSGVEELDMFLGADCVDVSCPGVDTTCTGGACKSIVVDPMTLKPFDPGDIEAGPLFDGTLPAIDGSKDDSGKDGTSPDAPADSHADAGSSGPDADASSADVHADAPKEAASCGAPGESCCLFHQCNAGCCVYGTCVGQGAACTGLGPVGVPPPACTNANCGNCGAPNQACCMGTGGSTCTAPFTQCLSGTCVACGMAGQSCCPGAGGTCTPGNVCQQPAGDAGNGTCTQCGGPSEPCCDVTSTVQGAPTTPCMPGSGLSCSSSNRCM